MCLNHAFEKETRPLYYYDAGLNRLLVAGREDAAREDADIWAIDIATRGMKKIGTSVKWPLVFTNEGLFVQNGADLFVQEINLEFYFDDNQLSSKTPAKIYTVRTNPAGQPLDEMKFGVRDLVLSRGNADGRKYVYSINARGELKRYTAGGTRFKPTSEQIRGLMKDVPAEDWLEKVKLGLKTPIYGMSPVERTIVDQLSQLENTWLYMRYNDGQLPDDLLISFVWNLISQAVRADDDMRATDAIWAIDTEELFNRDPEEVLKLLQIIYTAALDTRSIIVFRDYHSTREISDPQISGPPWNYFYSFFGDCIQQGRCRVITTTREPVFKIADRLAHDILESERVTSFQPSKRQTKRVWHVKLYAFWNTKGHPDR